MVLTRGRCSTQEDVALLTIRFGDSICVQVSLSPVDFRLGLNGLLAIIEAVFSKNPQEEYLFLFRDRTRKKIKAVYWDKNGFMLLYKRMETEKFQFPKLIDGEIQLNRLQLECLLSGMDFMKEISSKPNKYVVYS